MPRPKNTINYEANSQTIRKFFELSMKLREEQQDCNTMISALNAEMQAAGVHPGILATCRRIADLPEGKRGWVIALTRFYLDVLEDVLKDSQVDINDLIRQAKAREMETVAPEPAKNSKIRAIS